MNFLIFSAKLRLLTIAASSILWFRQCRLRFVGRKKLAELELFKTGGPFLVAIVLIYRMYFDSKNPTPPPTTYDRDIMRLERAIGKVEERNNRSYESFIQSLQHFTSCINKLSAKLDLHAKSLEMINGNLEAISERLTHLERKN